jgi:hypothetical protein
MNFMTIKRVVSVDARWDVIVVGGGPAGCTAAAAAAREGAKTLLIEATGSLGGMGTNGLVPAWCPFSDQQRIIYAGLAEKVFTACKAGMPHVDPKKLDWVAIDPELLKRVYDDLVVDAGATILFHTLLSAVQTKKGRVSEILVTNKAGLTAYRARVFVDATGDGDLAVWAGAKAHKGDAKGKSLQPATHCFQLDNVDEYAYLHGERLFSTNPKAAIYPILRSGRYPLVPDIHICNNLVAPRRVGFNAGHLFGVDGTDPAALSKAMIFGRKMAAQFRDGLAEFQPAAFGNARVAATGALMGIRETRRMVGDYVLTADDYLRRRSFPDEICRNNYCIDVHNKDPKLAQSCDDMQKLVAEAVPYGPGESHGIPYRCLTPKGLANVLVAGRSISCDQRMQGSVRVMPVCLAMGEAAGMAAAFAARAKRPDVHAVDTARLRRRLRAHGAWLPESK